MAGIILIVAVLVVLVLIGMALAWNVAKLVIFLFVAGFIGWLADTIVPGRMPWGWLGAILAGLVGSWLGSIIMGQWGPSLAGIYLVPALLGAIILAFIANVVGKGMVGTRG